MAAKQSQEMKDALALVRSGIPVRKAAEASGVWFTSLYAAIRNEERKAAAESDTVKKEAVQVRSRKKVEPETETYNPVQYAADVVQNID